MEWKTIEGCKEPISPSRVRNTKLSELQQWPEEDIKRSLSVIEKEIKDGLSARHWLEGILKLRGVNND